MTKKKRKGRKLDYSLSAINHAEDMEMELSGWVEHSTINAKAILWIAYKFIEEEETHITSKGLSHFLKKIPQRTTQILNMLVMHGVLSDRKRGKFRETIFTLKDEELLRSLISLAKNTVEMQ